ncbi:TPA: hypothetical protein ACX6QE_002035 [Photobacterium damselae]
MQSLRYLLVFALLAPFRAFALNGASIYLENIKTDYYIKYNSKPIFYYQLKAEHKTEIYSNSKNIFTQYFDRNVAKVHNFFTDGIFSTRNVVINFKQAYYFNGSLFLEQTTGSIGHNNISAKEIKFRLKDNMLLAKHIRFISAESTSTKINYQYHIKITNEKKT